LIANSKNLFLYFIIFVVSFIFYEGLINGSDHQFVYNWILEHQKFDGNLLNYIDQADPTKTFHYTFWIIHDYVIFFIFKVISYISGVQNPFFYEYAIGWILTFYFFLGYLVFYNELIKQKIISSIAFILASSIFFGSAIICFSTGYVSECGILLLFVLRMKTNNIYYKFIFDILIIFIKPYYLIVSGILILSQIDNINNIKVNNFKNYIDNFLKKEFIYVSLLVIFFISTKIQLLLFSDFTDSFFRGFDLFYFFRNFILLFFSPSFGLLFTFSSIVILLIKGWNGIATILKVLSIILLSFFLSLLPYWHGQMGGSRYLAPALIIFLPEIIIAAKIIQKQILLKNNFIILILIFITILNIPVVEYRNTAINEYVSNTVVKNKTYQQRFSYNDGDQNYYNFYDIKFHPSIFATNIMISKSLGIDVNINNVFRKIPNKNFYPQSGFGRIIFIEKNSLNKTYSYPIKLNYKLLLLIQATYFLFFLNYISLLLFCLFKVLKFKA